MTCHWHLCCLNLTPSFYPCHSCSYPCSSSHFPGKLGHNLCSCEQLLWPCRIEPVCFSGSGTPSNRELAHVPLNSHNGATSMASLYNNVFTRCQYFLTKFDSFFLTLPIRAKALDSTLATHKLWTNASITQAQSLLTSIATSKYHFRACYFSNPEKTRILNTGSSIFASVVTMNFSSQFSTSYSLSPYKWLYFNRLRSARRQRLAGLASIGPGPPLFRLGRSALLDKESQWLLSIGESNCWTITIVTVATTISVKKA